MANLRHVRKLRKGATVWNPWVAKQAAGFQADLQGADLRQADLRDTQLTHADLTDADLAGARLNRAHLYAASLRSANLMNTSLREADLRETDLRGACLDRASLVEAKLRGADLGTASLFGTDLKGSLLNGATFESALSDETTLWPREQQEALAAAGPEQAMAGGIRFGNGLDTTDPTPGLGRRSLSSIAPGVETGPMPALGCRVKSLSDRARRTDAVAAINQLITVFWRLQFSSPMTDLQEAELQAQIGVLETMLRNPSGPNLVITERAVVAGLRALDGRFDRCSPIMRSIAEVASGLGDEDRRRDGLPLAQLIDLLLRWASNANQPPEPVGDSGYLRAELAAALVIIGTELPGDGDDEQVAELARAIILLATAIWER